ncbi:Cysteine-rich TM module stress tolerance [Streptomyces sp. 3213]|nr:Cysteine-rich TM module stress tolerance [Streptomyces sp. 3213] [Streptomyces sp. 3213.3]
MSFTPRGVVVFGMVRPCSHRLGENLKTQWLAHLCGLCLALRGDHGQFVRIVTNYDGLLLSVLTEAQVERESGGWRRTAGPCPLRGMRTASVAQGEGARLAAAVSLVLASAKVRDHVADGDGLLARRPVALAARRVAGSWGRAGARTGAGVGFDAGVLVEAVERQFGIEALAGPGTPILTVTEPTETATAAAFAHTAFLAGRPGNAVPLAEAGRLFGRLAHLLDAVEDRESDAASGAWNPLTATGTPLTEARRLADDALHGIRLALRETSFTDGKLAHLLLAHELGRSVDRAFGTQSCGHGPEAAFGPPQTPYLPGDPRHDGNPYGGNPFGGEPPRPDKRGFWAGCAAALGLCCTCKVCCADEFEGPWSGRRREGCCSSCDCSCCDACECCECCECLSCCDC